MCVCVRARVCVCEAERVCVFVRERQSVCVSQAHHPPPDVVVGQVLVDVLAATPATLPHTTDTLPPLFNWYALIETVLCCCVGVVVVVCGRAPSPVLRMPNADSNLLQQHTASGLCGCSGMEVTPAALCMKPPAFCSGLFLSWELPVDMNICVPFHTATPNY